MPEKFSKRFNTEVSIDEARRQFVNRVHNVIWGTFIGDFYLHGGRPDKYIQATVTHIGEKYAGRGGIEEYVKDDFLVNLKGIEGLYHAVSTREQQSLVSIIQRIIFASEIDLGIRWVNDHFSATGAPVLDQALVNDVLGIVNAAGHTGVSTPFVKGLDHYLRSLKNSALLSDVVTDMYEALEALAKIVCSNDKGINANRDTFISKLGLSDSYNKILREYIEYANTLRHAGEQGQAKKPPSRREVEGFLYLTGLFIRLALSKH